MKNRKPTLAQQKEIAKMNLRDEIKTQKTFLDDAERKVDALTCKIKEGDLSVKNELEDQIETVQRIKEKLEGYKSQLEQLKA